MASIPQRSMHSWGFGSEPHLEAARSRQQEWHFDLCWPEAQVTVGSCLRVNRERAGSDFVIIAVNTHSVDAGDEKRYDLHLHLIRQNGI